MKHGAERAIADERAADERYRIGLRREESRRVPVHQGYGDARRIPSKAALTPVPPRRGLLGRVELAEHTDFFDGTNFYIGSRPLDADGLMVFSWAAPIASTFFQNRGTHDLCPRVTARRTLLRRGGQITDYVDDDGPAPRTAEPFAARRLSIPKAPARRPLPGRSIPEQRSLKSAAQARTDRQPAQPQQTASTLRAGLAVLAAIEAPRAERLTSVLATLQPDQYTHVTAAADASVVIQGHPGTGKTVIAAHRAAFLVHRDNEQRCRSVLIVGPTAHYVRHISGVIDDLVEEEGSVDSLAIEEVLLEFRGLSAQIDGSQPVVLRDTHSELAEFAEQAARLLRDEGEIGPRVAHADCVRHVYEALRHNRVGRARLTRDRDWARYLRELPEFELASTQRRYLGLLAACGVAAAGAPPYAYDHVIVDEAQDLTALEWAVLMRMNRGSWTLLGDINQRRSDLSCHSWSRVSTVLGRPLAVETLRCGYRSTAAIMQFAGRLLSREEQTVESLQTGGVPPAIRKARPTELYIRVSAEVSAVLSRHPEGTAAVISMAPQQVVRALRIAGYHEDPADDTTMVRDGERVRVLDPQEARGLEFDAAIVVEPGNFPPRLGGHGLLYTSLTRANRELVIIHSNPLPAALRRPGGASTTPADPAWKAARRQRGA
ncbi:AAA family ATPase [Pseudonocardia pini]|uniref:AAA family ATPase n=1 Tax=Pseudonocardia pini TaxID=2758030 RepID=UPI0015F11DAC|nr:AAA family ATPase [Pseudonocardia pini]